MIKKQFSENPITVELICDVNALKNTHTRAQKIQFKCILCGNDYVAVLANFKKFICKKCNQKKAAFSKSDEEWKAIAEKRKATNIKKYGNISPLKNEEVVEKMKQNNLKKYGVEWAASSDVVKNNVEKSIIEKYGSRENFNKILKQSQERAIIEKYGVTNVSYIQEVVDKRRDTFESHKKDPDFLKSIRRKANITIELNKKNNSNYESDILEKRKQTLLERYGVDHNFKIPEVIEHRKQYFLDKFGFENPAKNEQVIGKEKHTIQSRTESEWHRINKLRSKKYKYDNILFDSWPEVCMYIYLRDNAIEFIYKPEVYFEYLYDGTIHKYFPDFLVEDTLIELKGDHFFEDKDPSKRMICPFNRDNDDLYEAKHLCMKQHNVEILTGKNYNVFTDYVEKELNLDKETFKYEK